MQSSPTNTLSLFDAVSFRRMLLIIAALLCFSVALSYLFQELVFHNHCITKLGIILTGNFMYWMAAFPLITMYSVKMAGSRHFVPASLAMGAGLLLINQLFIAKAIYVIFLYGFGCLEGITNPAYMLFENNILTSGLICSLLMLVAYHRAVAARKREIVSTSNATEEKVTPCYRSALIVKENGSTFRVDVQDIRYIEANRNTIIIFAVNRKYVLYQSMTSIEKELDPACFVKIHRSFLVNRSFILSYTTIGNGNRMVKLRCGAELVMTRHYRMREGYGVAGDIQNV